MEKSEKILNKGSANRTKGSFFENKPERDFFAQEAQSSHEHTFFKSQTPTLATSGLNSVQTKLSVGSANDKYEIEADAVAGKVMGATDMSMTEMDFDGADEDKPMMRLSKTISAKKSDSTNTDSQINTGTENKIKSSRGQGTPMSIGTRSFMESRFGADFGHVNIHKDEQAAQLNRELGARAFAYGNDIYFNQNEYKPETNSGKYLLAHELTHTIQQGNGIGLSVQQKKANNTNSSDSTTNINQPTSTEANKTTPIENGVVEKSDFYKDEKTGESIDVKGKKIVLKSLSVPTIKEEFSKKIIISKDKKKRDNTQISVWENSALASKEVIRKKIDDKKSGEQKQTAQPDAVTDDKIAIYYLRLIKSSEKDVLIGKFDDLLPRLVRPYWNRKGQRNYYDVDHKTELQLGGENTIENLWLLDANINRSSGSKIKDKIEETVNTFLIKAAPYLNTSLKSFSKDVKSQYDVEFSEGGKASPQMDVTHKKEKEDLTWSLEQVKQGLTLDGLKLMTESEVEKAGYAGKKNQLALYRGKLGGYAIMIPWNEKEQQNGMAEGLNLNLKSYKKTMIKIKSVVYDSLKKEGVNPADNYVIAIFKDKMLVEKSLQFFIEKFEGVEYGGRIDYKSFEKAIIKDGLILKGMSPIKVTVVRLDEDEFRIEGKVLPTVPIIKDADIDIIIDDDGVRIRKLFTKNDFKLPKPFNVTDSSLEVYFSGDDVGLNGELNFEIIKLGQGSIKGKFSIKKGFELEGLFSFDSTYFNPAIVNLKYEKEKWRIGGTVGIPEGKIKGIKNAKLDLNYADDKLSAEGNAMLNVPGVDEVKLSAEFGKNGQFKIKGDAVFKEMPGIKSGNASVTLASGENGMKLRLEGKAVPNLAKVPGLDAELNVLYDDGLFDMSTQVNYNKGKFNGIIQVGITNRVVNDEGKPKGAPDEIGIPKIYGYGVLTVQLLKNTTAEMSVRLTPEGEVMVGGEVKMENQKLFGQGYHIKDKELTKIPQITIPLIGIPGFNISAFIKGGVYFSFNWDPLVLKELSLKLQEVKIDELNKAQFDIYGSVGSMANAELYLSVDVGVQGRIAVLVLKGSIGGQAGIGIKAEVGGSVDAEWDMQKGLQLKEIVANMEAAPYALFRLVGKISGDIDLWLTTINLFSKEYKMAEGQFDLSGLALKVNFPIKFDEQNNPIFPAFNQMDMERPSFEGEQGKKMMGKVINADAEKELTEKKRKIKSEIIVGLRKNKKDKNFSYGAYREDMSKKYGDAKELKEYVLDVIDEEVKKLEQERFQLIKIEMRKSSLALEDKKIVLNFYTQYNSYISKEEVSNFIEELERMEVEKQESLMATKELSN